MARELTDKSYGSRTEAIGFQKASAVTPNDSTDLSGGVTRGLYIGAAGNVAVLMADGSAVTLTALAVGVTHPIAVSRVKSTGTTATSILALY